MCFHVYIRRHKLVAHCHLFLFFFSFLALKHFGIKKQYFKEACIISLTSRFSEKIDISGNPMSSYPGGIEARGCL